MHKENEQVDKQLSPAMDRRTTLKSRWRRPMRTRTSLLFNSMALLVTLLIHPVRTQCPWSKSLTDLHSSCSCSFVQSKLNVQCNAVNVTRLLDALRDGDKDEDKSVNTSSTTTTTTTSAVTPIESLEVTNSSVPILADNAFYNLRVSNIHFAHCGLRNISAHALKTSNLEEGLLSLSLPDNELTDGALTPLRKLRSLSLLDLSRNRINRLDDDTFKGLTSLDTLNLMENNLTAIGKNAFRGMETSLKNLNLKGTGQTVLPQALRSMSALAFLDLAQNSIEDVGASFFASMDSLTALSLERNRLGQLDADAFKGLEDTMSSLSLLNNDFKEMPKMAVAILKELRVLDLGFNRIYEIPEDAFQNLSSLTLLALDGNPLVTLPFAALKHLHATLRGLSIGGKSLVCDCHIRWIAEWVREYDLQVTSRERNPQFCGHPEAQQNKNLYLLRPAQLVCPETTTAAATTTTTTESQSQPPSSTTIATTTTTIQSTTNGTTTTTTTTTTAATTMTTQRAKSLDIVNVTAFTQKPVDPPPSIIRTPANNNNQRSARKDSNGQDIKIREAFREDTNVVLTWELTSANVAGFRVIYRTFGDDGFKEGAVLPLRVRKFRMTNVPSSECCLIVCVVSLGEPTNLTFDNVPSSNCRELKWGTPDANLAAAAAGQPNVDMIVIILVVAVGCTVIVAVLIICVCCCRQRCSKRRREKSLPPPPPPIVELPPLEPSSIKPEWDQTSAYSSRSIPRARMYHMARTGGTVNSAYLPDDARSHLSLAKHHGGGGGVAVVDDRVMSHSMIDGQYGVGSYVDSQYPMGRPELNRSSKSLAMSMPVYHVHNQNHMGGTTTTAATATTATNNNNNNNRKKNKTHQNQQRNGHTNKWASHHGSTHSLNNGYGERDPNGYFNHPNPWSSPADADHYNPNGSHVSQPFNKRDYT